MIYIIGSLRVFDKARPSCAGKVRGQRWQPVRRELRKRHVIALTFRVKSNHVVAGRIKKRAATLLMAAGQRQRRTASPRADAILR